MGKSKKEAIEYVAKNCYNSVTKDQVRDIIALLEVFGMMPPESGERMIIEQGVIFKVPVYGWVDSKGE
jgi:hypothetical protein